MQRVGKAFTGISEVLLPLMAAALLPGCAEDDAPPPPFGARQIVQTRDFDRALAGFDATRTKLYLTRRLADFGHREPGRSSTLDDVFALDVASGDEELLAEKVHWFAELGRPGVEGPLLFVRQDSLEYQAPTTLTLRLPSGEKKDFVNVVASSIGWNDELLVFIRDDGVRRELWAGAFVEPRLMSADLYVHDWQFSGPGRLALAADPDGQRATGIFRLETASGQISVEFPAKIEAADWAGEGDAPPLASPGLAGLLGVGNRLVTELFGACWSPTEPRAIGAADQRCYLLYRRSMSDGSDRSFVGLPDEHREIALPGFTDEFGTAGPDRHYLPFFGNAPLAAWLSWDLEDGEALMLNAWDAPNSRLVRCEVPSGLPGSFSWRDDGAAYLYPGNLVASGIEGCSPTGIPATAQASFSPDATRLVWWFEDGLWTGGGSGERPRRVLENAHFRSLDFIGEDRVIGLHVFTDGVGLMVIDLSESAPRPRALLEQVSSLGPYVGTRSVFCENSYNAQDRTGKLSLLDLESFAVEDVAESVAGSAVGWPPASGAESFPFAYVRTGRFASSRDGLWVGSIPRERVEP